MYPLFESLAIRNGKIQNLDFHEARYRCAYEELYGNKAKVSLLEKLDLNLPIEGLYKLRIAYSATAKSAEYSPYTIKPIDTLKAIDTTKLDYHLKYSNRHTINNLFALRQVCDDVLIINNDLVSDTSVGNILFLKAGKWYTPNSPLLEGTQRAKLLKEGQILSVPIAKADIKNYDAFQVINAMRPFDSKNSCNINNIIF